MTVYGVAGNDVLPSYRKKAEKLCDGVGIGK